MKVQPNRCEALIASHGGSHLDLRGMQCREPAVETKNGHRVCWLHSGKIRKIRFVT